MKKNILDDKLRMLPKERQIPEDAPKTFVLFPFELHAKMKESFEEKEKESFELVKNHLKEFKNTFVASSRGKDSVIVEHLVIRAWNELRDEGIDKPKPKIFLNHTLNTYKEENEYWKLLNDWMNVSDVFKVFYPPNDENGKPYTVWSIAEKVGHLPLFRSTSKKGKKDYKHTNIPECCDLLKKASIKEFLKQLSDEEKFDCHFVGTRAEESQMRSLGVLQRCRSYTITSRFPYPIRAVTPLSFWKKEDVQKYFEKYNIPVNPVYKIHNLERMGCASCPAHIGWELRLMKDPTNEGFGMLKLNLKILQKTDKERFNDSINEVRKNLKTYKLSLRQQNSIIALLRELQQLENETIERFC